MRRPALSLSATNFSSAGASIRSVGAALGGDAPQSRGGAIGCVQVFGHELGGCAELVGLQRVDDAEVLAQPGLNAPAVVIAAKLDQAPQPVVLLDGLDEEAVV